MRTLITLIQLLVADRQRLMVENLALRHQLAVLKRTVKQPRIEGSDRRLWILLRRAFKEWRDAVIFVQPDTVVRWHRKGFRYYWKRKSKSNPGRPPISFALRRGSKRGIRQAPGDELVESKANAARGEVVCRERLGRLLKFCSRAA